MKHKSIKLEEVHIEAEWREGNDYWISLMPGWRWAGDNEFAYHTIHENSKKEAREQRIVRCNCDNCKAALRKKRTTQT